MSGDILDRALAAKAVITIVAALLLSGCQQEGGAQIAPIAPTPVAESLEQVTTKALDAMGMAGVGRIEYTADGWEACLGQPWNIDDGWARWAITDYSRVIDYDTFNSVQTAQRQAGMDPDKLGGCGAQPGAAVQTQRSSVNVSSPWLQQLQVHLTPPGFLKLAGSVNAAVMRGDGGLQLAMDVDSGGITYHLVGSYGDDYLLDHVLTRVDDSVFGDMAFEAEFNDYRNFNGVVFPGHIVQKQGGFATLDLVVNSVDPATTTSAEPPEGSGRFGGGQQPDLPPYERLGEGIYALHGAYQSVVMGFADFTVVLDGLQNDARADEIIALAKELFPAKPIGYVLTTHNHFDHASGLRQFVAEGATILTHDTNVDFYAEALANPRTLNPDAIDTSGLPVDILGVGDFLAIDDGTQRVEFHKLSGSTHADDALIAFIPAIQTIVEADLLQPWINPVFGGGDHPFLVWLAGELDRLGIDYAQFVPVHRPASPPLMIKAELMDAVGRN